MFPKPRHGREVEPPDGRGREESQAESDDPRRGQVQARRGGAGQYYGLAQRKDDEQPEPLGEMLRTYRPVCAFHPSQTRNFKQGDRPSVVYGDSRTPE